MAVTDPIADMLTMVRNASSAKKEVVEVKNSRLTEEVIKIFKKERFISNYKIIKDSILRYQRMNGRNVIDRAGYDMHGLPI